MHYQYSSVVPLRWLSEPQRNQLVAHIRSACTQVLSSWSAAREGALPAVRYAEDHRPLSGNRFYVELKSEVLAVWSFEADSLQHLLHLPLGSQVSTHDDEDFMARLEMDLVTTLSRSLLADNAHDQVTIRRALRADVSALDGKGTHHVFDIGCDGRTFCCQLELSPILVNRLIPRSVSKGKTNLVSRRAAIGNEAITLRANLGQVELSFTELHGLIVGDVLVMEQALTRPVTIHTTAGQQVAEAALGRHKTQLALQIATLAMPILSAKRSIQ